MPVGPKDKLCFNAHRIYNPQTIIQTLDCMQLLEFGYIMDFDAKLCMEFRDSKVHVDKNALLSIPNYINNGVTGLFEFIKK